MAEYTTLDKQIFSDALLYHKFPKPGKTEISTTKIIANQRDLSLAYSPGVAAPCMEIEKTPSNVYHYTNKGNLVAVITNGTAVLGLGNIGPLAAKPVMEGKAMLFKKFSGIDVYDIEINETDIDKFVEIVAALEPTFGGINLEDIKAPECFMIEEKLKKKLNIPVFHDDQHGTAIVVAAGIINGLKLVNKNISEVKIAVLGAGAAAIACLDQLVSLGANKKNIYLADSKGILNQHRKDKFDVTKARYLQETNYLTIDEALVNADIFLGCSGPNLITQDMIKTMAKNPLIFALSNPIPEIMPELIEQVRTDAIIATGRSDYPNQINNALCFPFIFRGALDVGATCINEEMKKAAVFAIAELALLEPGESITNAYDGDDLSFGSKYIIPKLLDQRLIKMIAPAVAKAAMESNVATRPIVNIDKYIEELNKYIYRSNIFMKPVFSAASKKLKKIVICEGEEIRVLHALQEVVDLKLANIILIGRPSVIEYRIKQLGLRVKPGIDFEIVNNESDLRFKDYWTTYYEQNKRMGVTPEEAKKTITRDTTLIGSLMLLKNQADGLICGTYGKFNQNLDTIKKVIGFNNDENICATVNAIILPSGNLFIADTFVNADPTATQLCKITEMASLLVKKFGITPKIALLSHSSFGSDLNSQSSIKMREVLNLFKSKFPNIEIDGEMNGDAALESSIRNKLMPDSPLKGRANLLIMPNIESANIAYNLIRVSTPECVSVGPILLGLKSPAYVLTDVSSARRIVNMVALACVESKSQ